MHEFTDEMLMQFADGELDDVTRARIETAMESDDALVERVGLFIETRAAAKDAMRPLLEEPVPVALQASVEAMIAKHRSGRDEDAPANNVVALPRRWRAANDWRVLAAAASVAAAVFGGFVGYQLSPTEGSRSPVQIAQVSAPELSKALSTIGTGQEAALATQRFKAIASFRNADQQLCREFELDGADRSTVVAVACAEDSSWHVRFAVVAPSGDGGYAPASSTDALEAYLLATNAGTALTAEEESAALSKIVGTGE